MTALDNAIRVAGSANKLASTLGVSGMAVSQWKTKVLCLHHEFYRFLMQRALRLMDYVLIYIRIRRMEYLRSDHANHLF